MLEDIPECRICFEIESYDDPFISPCLCKGTSKYVHKSCLNTWRNFNREAEGWKMCMECHETYTLQYKYPMEKDIFIKVKNPIMIYFFQYITALGVGSIFWLLDANTDYLAIKMLNFNVTLNKPSLLTYIKDDDLTPQVFYFCYAMFIQNMFYYLYFYYTTVKSVKRKKLYLKKINKDYFSSLFFTLQFIIWYYILVFNDRAIIFLNIVSFISMVEPIVYYQLIKKHKKIIKTLNFDENEEEILSYEENPLHGYENILNQIELGNIIVEFTPS
jgi:hypothetical protein